MKNSIIIITIIALVGFVASTFVGWAMAFTDSAEAAGITWAGGPVRVRVRPEPDGRTAASSPYGAPDGFALLQQT